MKKPRAITELPKELQPIFIKMLDMVGAPHDMKFGDDWYLKYSWTEEQRDEYEKWWVDYLYKNADARQTMLTFSCKTKAKIREAFWWFDFQWGWKIEGDGE